MPCGWNQCDDSIYGTAAGTVLKAVPANHQINPWILDHTICYERYARDIHQDERGDELRSYPRDPWALADSYSEPNM